MEKKKDFAFGKNIYLLGADEDGTKYWLEEASWDCGWYYGFGYIETYTNNKKPSLSRDINSHEHYDSKILKNGVCPDDFRKIFVNTPLTNDEIYKLNELMKTFYILKEYHAMIYMGGAHITKNSVSDLLKNEDEYKRLKDVVFPALFKEIYKLLGDDNNE